MATKSVKGKARFTFEQLEEVERSTEKRILAKKRDGKSKTRWHVPTGAPKTPDDLPFVGQDAEGRASWWNVTLPKTDYWHAHQVLGRAYAFELLDLMNNPDADFPEHILAHIVGAQMRWQGHDPCGGAIVIGFNEVLSEYIATGTANR